MLVNLQTKEDPIQDSVKNGDAEQVYLARFPAGLTLTAGEDTLEKLPIIRGMNKGDLVDIRAKGYIASVNNPDGKQNPGSIKSVVLQISDMEVDNKSQLDRDFKDAE